MLEHMRQMEKENNEQKRWWCHQTPQRNSNQEDVFKRKINSQNSRTIVLDFYSFSVRQCCLGIWTVKVPQPPHTCTNKSGQSSWGLKLYMSEL